MIKYISLLIFCITTFSSAQVTTTFFSKTDAFLKKNVSNGKVDYQTIKNDPASLNELVDMIASASYTNENTATQKAFLINAYNVLLIKAIITKYPVKSPMDISGLFDKTTFIISGKKYTLNDLENKLIRAQFNDARVHFVLVCGALGCPPITNFAYQPNQLESQLNKQTKLALNNPNFIKVNSASKKVEVSQIFEWYKTDFVTKTSTEIDFINQYRDTKIDVKYKMVYYAYDWTLNKK